MLWSGQFHIRDGIKWDYSAHQLVGFISFGENGDFQHRFRVLW